uniref:MATE family efflux transporter n=1 Tax=Succinivibrio sp. TaxID=2053619 RepID=UPI00402AA69B
MLFFVYCVLQGVGAGAQPLMSRFYGERRFTDYAITRRLSLFTALFLAAVSIVIIFVARDNLGNLFGTSDEAALEIAIATPVFLVGMFFYAYSMICSSAFYSTERETLS